MKLENVIEVKSSHVAQRAVKSNKDGKDYLFRDQRGWIDLGKEYPTEIRIPLEPAQQPYAPGTYRVDPACLYVDRYGRLSLGRLRLVPVS
jgi:hypothetical protein